MKSRQIKVFQSLWQWEGARAGYLLLWIILWGIGPCTLSIIARCSLLSWVCKWTQEEVKTMTNKKTKFVLLLCRMCDLEECEPFVVFKQDAANTPHITRLTPTQLCGRRNSFVTNWTGQVLDTPRAKMTFLTKYDLWGSVVTSRDDDRVVFVVKGGAAEVDEPHRGVVYPPFIALLNGRQVETL